jgi:hypothetical protein
MEGEKRVTFDDPPAKRQRQGDEPPAQGGAPEQEAGLRANDILEIKLGKRSAACFCQRISAKERYVANMKQFTRTSSFRFIQLSRIKFGKASCSEATR